MVSFLGPAGHNYCHTVACIIYFDILMTISLFNSKKVNNCEANEVTVVYNEEMNHLLRFTNSLNSSITATNCIKYILSIHGTH